jgi:hypothetical protein
VVASGFKVLKATDARITIFRASVAKRFDEASLKPDITEIVILVKCIPDSTKLRPCSCIFAGSIYLIFLLLAIFKT